VIDKITILEIKLSKITDKLKLRNIHNELEILNHALNKFVIKSVELQHLTEKLSHINEQLWEVEDQIRDKERTKTFDEDFIDLARSVYKINDERAATKLKINQLLGSDIIEEKSYQTY
jgi:predicted  nucleic acid-binding Zn-ribbon protein